MSRPPLLLRYPPELPISERRDEIIAAIRDHRVLIVAGDTGSGKTTQLPKMCLEAGRGVAGLVGCTQPRRIAAITVAERLAAETMTVAGEEIGYKIRFRDRTGPKTRVKFMTDGILLAEMQGDRDLAAYDTLVVDEAHERSLNIDFLLGVMQRLLARRDDLRLIITSATIDTDKFSRAFAGAPVIRVGGRCHPVEVRYRPPADSSGDTTHVEQAIEAVAELHAGADPGDILVFMPTEQDIRETVAGLGQRLAGPGARRQAVVLPLFGRMTAGEQQLVFQQVAGRKIVVATNVAETALTVPGIRFVVDSGLARMSFYSPRSHSTKMPVARVSRASCEQRTGRCGRTGPGVCIRLYSEEDYQGRPPYTPPELLRTNLAEVILRMLALGLGDPAAFPFIDPPSSRSIRDGQNLLEELGAVRSQDGERRLTGVGAIMARLPVDPRLSRMIVEARNLSCLDEAVVIAAALSIQDPRLRPATLEQQADAAHRRFVDPTSDFVTLLRIWQAFTGDKFANSRGQQRKFCRSSYLSFQRMREWEDIHGQIWRVLGGEKGFRKNRQPAPAEPLHRAVLAGNLRHIAVKKEKNLYTGTGGRECLLHPGSGLHNRGPAWIVAAEIVETSRRFARGAAAIRPEWIEPLAGELCRRSWGEPHWEKGRGQVVALERVLLFGLTIVAGRKVSWSRINPGEAREIFIRAALVEGELGGRCEFLEHNRALVAEIEEIGDRLRSREMVVDEEKLFRFYEKALPETICDRAGLNDFLRRNRGDRRLFLRREDLLHEGETGLEHFPAELVLGSLRLPLSYVFAPGEADDGVTVTLPAGIGAEVPEEVFDWLVPGMIEEKIVALLKGLPKAKRRPLVPVQQTAARLAAALPFRQGSLYGVLERELLRSYGVTVRRDEWPLAALPPHLNMRFVVTGRGRELLATRDAAALRPAAAGERVAPAALERLRDSFRFRGTLGEILPRLPASVAVEDPRGGLVGYAYPALRLADDGQVECTLVESEAERRRLNRQAFLALARRRLAGQWKMVQKEVRLAKADWALAQGIGEAGAFDAALQEFVFAAALGLAESLPDHAADFERLLEAAVARGVYSACLELAEKVIRVLRQRRDLLDRLRDMGQTPAIAGQLAEIRRHLDELVPAAFFRMLDEERLASLGRYLQAAAVRLDRLRHDPGRDRQKFARLAPHLERLASCADGAALHPDGRELLRQYRAMVEEYRVSLFAQEIRTPFPVSETRLEEKWREIFVFFRRPPAGGAAKCHGMD
ncbi:MAG: ATP-dependent RNA helicase HrpA [Thermodesulfobacteriota bacterium]